MIDYVLIGVLGFSVLLLCVFYVGIFTRFGESPSTSAHSTHVSIVIAARNEIKNLKVNLPLILNQKYSDFEVVVVNDGSFDGTKDFLDKLGQQHANLKVVHLNLDERFQKGKKFAITMGIKAAKHHRLLFTDADCKPASENWLSKMHSHATTDIVIGIAPLQTKKTILGSLISYETFHTALQMVSYAKAGMAYMGLGRNLSYTKDLFFANKGFASHQHLLSGDDDLFIQEVATKSNTSVCLDREAFMFSPGPSSFGAWFKQKKRHLSTSKHYKSKFKTLLGLYSFGQLLFLIAAITALIASNYLMVVGGIILLKWLVQIAILIKPAKKIGQLSFVYLIPYYDSLYTFYLLLFGFSKPFIKVKSWN